MKSNDLKLANELFRNKKFEEALDKYNAFSSENDTLEVSVNYFKNIVQKKIELKLSGNSTPLPQEDHLAIKIHDEKYLTTTFLATPLNFSKITANINNYIKSEKYHWANFILSKIIESEPDNIKFLFLKAQLMFAVQAYQKAIKICDQIISLDSEYRGAYQIAEQASIEVEEFDNANNYFLSQPQVDYSDDCRGRGDNPVLPSGFIVQPVNGNGNDYSHISEQIEVFKSNNSNYTKKASVIVTVYNRSEILANTLAALTHQTYPMELIEVIVIDDGSCDDVAGVVKKYENKIDINLIRQPDKGYRLARARNLGLKISRGEGIIFMDADILPLPTDIENYMRAIHVTTNAVLIGHRRYVDVSQVNDDQILKDIEIVANLPTINPNNDVAGRKCDEGFSVDWRYEAYKNTNYLKTDLWPFNKASGGNIAFSKELYEKAGGIDEDFEAWGCEDGEHGFRMFNAGAYFIPMLEIESIHQEPINDLGEESFADGESFRSKGHKITQKLLEQKCPAIYSRKYTKGKSYEVPKVSIYIPAYNAEKYIVEAVQSCLNQTFKDLEVVICNDGSTDSTEALLQHHFGNKTNVRWVNNKNGGIGTATNTAITLCKGIYVAQLDADDTLKKDAVMECIKILDHKNIDAVYTDCEYINSNSEYVRDGWCGGEFKRSWMATSMIATHFRMFKRRVWERTIGANENIKNAVDLDLWLKFNEVAVIEHIHKKLYQYRWHGKNTSIANRKQQEFNHLKVVNDSFKRLGLDEFWEVKKIDNKLNPRDFKVVAHDYSVNFSDIFFLIPTCEKYSHKTDAVRNTWKADLPSFGVNSLFLMGDESLNESKIVGDVLYVPCPDNYESLLLKLALGYQFIYRNFNFKYVMKIDDDCFPDLDKFDKKIIPQLSGKQYLAGATHPKGAPMNDKWHFGKCSDSKFDKQFKFNVSPIEFGKGGYGYFLRKDILPAIFGEISAFKQELQDGVYSYEDFRVAEILNSKNIHVVHATDYNVEASTSENLKDYTLVFDITNTTKFSELQNKTTADLKD
ncbi:MULTISPECIES: glycosyltransferase [Colwellia]|uniref:Glycosyl transferase n=1 Tax=Colwellia marinimaniae TaxID=1513592 RepID=A0ABQ0MTN2_9GAMM|nr:MULTISPECIES: glycosyltransferase [Colwellia]GAW95728.1 glycosyl transferase [Colwellia marinimaniae]